MDNQDQENEDWNDFLDAQAAKRDAIIEEEYDEFMKAVNADDTDALQRIADNAVVSFNHRVVAFDGEEEHPRIGDMSQVADLSDAVFINDPEEVVEFIYNLGIIADKDMPASLFVVIEQGDTLKVWGHTSLAPETISYAELLWQRTPPVQFSTGSIAPLGAEGKNAMSTEIKRTEKTKKYQIVEINDTVTNASGRGSYQMISEQVLAEADRMTEMKEYAMREIYNHATSGYKNPIDMVVKTVYSEIGECVIAQRMLSHYVMSTIMMKRMW